MTVEQLKALKAIGDALLESIAIAGVNGAPAGTLYAALMQYGCTLEQFNGIMRGLEKAGMVRKSGQLYFSGRTVR